MKKAILTMGLPGAGKSYVVNNKLGLDTSSWAMIDPDAIKEEKEDYNPKQPEIYHEWSKQEAKKRTALAIEQGKNIVIDGTGTNVEKMVKQITCLQENGYDVTLLYVKVKLSTSLRRNAERDRNVPEYVIFEKFETIEPACAILSGYANSFTTIEND